MRVPARGWAHQAEVGRPAKPLLLRNPSLRKTLAAAPKVVEREGEYGRDSASRCGGQSAS